MNSPQPAKSRLWPAMIFLLLGFNVTVVAITVFAAQHYKAVVVDRSYDVAAQNWDEAKAQHDRQTALGWTCALSVDASAPQRTLRVAVNDASGQPVPGATVEVECFHNAHAAQPLALTAHGDGNAYSTPVPAMRDGLWTFHVRVTTAREEARFTLEREAASLANAEVSR